MQLQYISLFLSLSVIFFIAADTVAYNVNELQKEKQFLQSELKLARKNKIYFIFNLREKNISLKSRGILLKKLEIDTVRIWGHPPDPKPQSLIKKSSLLKPRRKEIKPDDTKNINATENKFKIEALEPDDMPSSFHVALDKGVIVTVRKKPTGFFSGLGNTCHSFIWRSTRPILTVWNTMNKKPFTAVYITMDKKDIQSFYWSFTEGPVIIYYP